MQFAYSYQRWLFNFQFLMFRKECEFRVFDDIERKFDCWAWVGFACGGWKIENNPVKRKSYQSFHSSEANWLKRTDKKFFWACQWGVNGFVVKVNNLNAGEIDRYIVLRRCSSQNSVVWLRKRVDSGAVANVFYTKVELDSSQQFSYLPLFVLVNFRVKSFLNKVYSFMYIRDRFWN